MDYIGTGRSNYVKVKDVKKWKKLCTKYGLGFLRERDTDKMGFHAENEDGYPVTSHYDEKKEEDIEYPDMMEAFAELIEDGEVLVFMHTGSEGLRYLGFSAEAINSKKEKASFSMEDFYQMAEKLGPNVTPCNG